MESGPTPASAVALELVSTIRHDGEGGVADDLATVEGAARWIRARNEPVAGRVPADEVVADEVVVNEALRAELVELRQAVRALFARAVAPGPPSPADAGRPMPAGRALAHLNAVAAREAVAPQLDWPPDGVPSVRPLSAEHDPRVRLMAGLARAAVDFLSGPERARLRACSAPRCVRYFVKSHGRQEWCKPSCGNRARAARHYRRRRVAAEDGSAPS